MKPGIALTYTLAAVVLTNLAAQPSLAQSPAARNTELDEVIVTARKRAENLQEVPLSIQAFTETELRRAGIRGLDGLAQSTIGLSFTDVNGAFQNPVIRGLSQTDLLGLEGNVGVFLDGVFLDNRSALEFGMIELDRVEVVKGPQSALYGRNTFAGAINYVTKGPSLEGFDALAEVTFGSDERRLYRGSFNVPIGDRFAIRVFAGKDKFDGTATNSRNGEQLAGFDIETYGGQILFEPTDNLAIRLFASRNERDDEQTGIRIFKPSEVNNCGARFNIAAAMQPAQIVNSLLCGAVPIPDVVNVDPRGRGTSSRADLSYLNVSYDAGPVVITALAAKTKSRAATFTDQAGDSTAFTRPLGVGSAYSEQFFTDSSGDIGESDSYELRFSSPEGARLQWMIGGSYFDTLSGGVTASASVRLLAPNIGSLDPITRVERRLTSEEKAVFGSLGYDFTERLSATAELRRAKVDQGFTGRTIILFIPNFQPVIVPPNSQDFTAWTPRLTVDWKASDDVLIYGSAARGWKAGGFNTSAAPFDRFEPETNWSFEVGAKSTLLDGRMTLNGAVYFIDWKNLQISQPINAVGTPATTNVGAATSKGIELEATYSVTDNFALRAGVTVLDPSFKDGVSDAANFLVCGLRPGSSVVAGTQCSTDVSGNTLPRTSTRQAVAGASYTLPQLVGDFDLYLRGDVSHQGKKYINTLNTAYIPAYTLVNMRAGLTNDAWELAVWANNLFDEAYLRNATGVPNQTANVNCTTAGTSCAVNDLRIDLANGRTFGLTATYRFR